MSTDVAPHNNVSAGLPACYASSFALGLYGFIGHWHMLTQAITGSAVGEHSDRSAA